MKTTTTYIKAITLLLCVMVASCSKDEPTPLPQPPITEISLNQTALTLNVQDTNQLIVTTNINNKTITWTSDTSKVVSVDENGTITALRGGTATITAQVENAQATCTITVLPDVYVLGNRSGSGTIWKNGEIIKDGFRVARDFFVTEKGIYVLTVNELFLNDEVLISGESDRYEFKNMYVVGEDVYVTGLEKSLLGEDLTLWKNDGTKQILTNNTRSAVVNLAVNNEDVYVLLAEETANSEANYVVWNNGTRTTITDDNGTVTAMALFVDNQDVYVGGFINNDTIDEFELRATIWKNGESTYLPEYGYVTSIFVKNNDVYASGTQFSDNDANSKAVFWKNGIVNTVSDGIGREYGNDIAIHDNDVYVAVGKYNNTAFVTLSLFKNGQETILATEGDDFSDASEYNKLFLF